MEFSFESATFVGAGSVVGSSGVMCLSMVSRRSYGEQIDRPYSSGTVAFGASKILFRLPASSVTATSQSPSHSEGRSGLGVFHTGRSVLIQKPPIPFTNPELVDNFGLWFNLKRFGKGMYTVITGCVFHRLRDPLWIRVAACYVHRWLNSGCPVGDGYRHF